MVNTLKTAVIQMEIKEGEVETNKEKAYSLINRCLKKNPDFILLPEMWSTGFQMDKMGDLAKETTDAILTDLVGIAKNNRVNILTGTLPELAKKNKLYNTMWFINSKGEKKGSYRKTHLFRLIGEEKTFTGGTDLGVINTSFGVLGLGICYELRFPELWRRLTLEGAKLFFLPAQFPHPRLEHWRVLIRARAIENQVFVVAANRVGKSGSADFFGHSMIVNPWGEIQAEAGEQEEIIYHEIDLKQIEEIRTKMPVLSDRLPSLYYTSNL